MVIFITHFLSDKFRATNVAADINNGDDNVDNIIRPEFVIISDHEISETINANHAKTIASDNITAASKTINERSDSTKRSLDSKNAHDVYLLELIKSVTYECLYFCVLVEAILPWKHPDQK